MSDDLSQMVPSDASQPLRENDEIRVIFLGYCERAAESQGPVAGAVNWNVMGFKQVVFSMIYPLPLRGNGYFIFAFYGKDIMNECLFRVTDENAREVGTITLSLRMASGEQIVSGEIPPGTTFIDTWAPIFIPLKKFNFIIPKPGTYHISLVGKEGSNLIGKIYFDLINPLTLSPDRIAAIKSDPNAAKAIKMELGCKECKAKYYTYAALDRSKKIESEGYVWYQDAAPTFVCDCKKTNIDLRVIRSNLHGLLGQKMTNNENLEFIPLYEKSYLEKIRTDYFSLLNSADKEEAYQRFIEANPILLHQFPAIRLFSKPKILTFFVADFGIVTPDKKLILIELEKPSTRLINKDGGRTAELNHAFDQVRDWIHTFNEHRLAALDALGVEREEVSSVRGVVIAGRDHGHDKKQLLKLKGADYGPISFLTYDDVGIALDVLIRSMR